MSAPLHGFPPIAAEGALVLILGNAPSVMSLAVRQYYGNPRNAFWRIMGQLYGFDPAAPYDERVAGLLSRGVAVWDVLASCRRAGSLDSAIERNSMVANGFSAFFTAHPAIDRVFFNGGAAEANYRRLVGVDSARTYIRLPSTSPAHTMRYDEKLAAWRAAVTR